MTPPTMAPAVDGSFSVPAVAIQTILLFLMDLALFGCLSVQIYLYYQAFPNDRRLTKALVYGIYVVQLVMTGVMIHDAFTIYGPGFSNISSVLKTHPTGYMVPIMASLSGFATQSFYAYRIRRLSDAWIVPCVILMISVTSCICGIVFGAFNSQISDVLGLQNAHNSYVTGIWLAGSAVTDILIAGWMIYYLTRYDTGFRETQEIISRLIRLIIETGTMTALVALATLILYVALPNHVYYAATGGILPKLYSIATLTILNSRLKIMGGRGMDRSHEAFISTPQFTHGATAPIEPNKLGVVTITREVFSDNSVEEGVEMKVMGGAGNSSPKDSELV
ncbi:hypothetical protein FB45DRAFT_1000327 [Roridomyces roridus]|uniref:DUF6534 domain-containing protein n=1 Tax=Roridomyces roridus TaxID=1738132 RepID=A0AAD7FWZ4_9AGAR|nr:hypothetical protein FB45DRAFT_1000327 [Roridomyces roridus]